MRYYGDEYRPIPFLITTFPFLQIISLSDVFISPLEDMYVLLSRTDLLSSFSISLFSYFVTELLGTDLHRLLTSRPLEKQFIQYFLYQILVSVSLG